MRKFGVIPAVICLLCLSKTIVAFSTPRTSQQLHVFEFRNSNSDDKHTNINRLHSTLSNTNTQNDSRPPSRTGTGKNKRQPINYPKNRYKRKPSTNKRRKKSPAEIQYNLRRADDVELRLSQALDQLQKEITWMRSTSSKEFSPPETRTPQNKISFPYVRDCNGALATFGDTGGLKRALRLFGQMRKSVTLVSTYTSLSDTSESDDTYQSSSRLFLCPPSPTLVTYSTLMSRAVSLGKERVALRLWRLMVSSPSFFANLSDSDSVDGIQIFQAPIVPDIRAVNILMNVFAKMGDQASAQMLMEQIYDGTVVPYDASMEKNGMIIAEEDEHGNDEGGTSSSSNEPYDAILEEEPGLRLIKVVPKMKPNIVTYNTLIDACHRAGDLDAGLAALDHMKANTDLRPDAMTYTSLISSVARRATMSSGKSDPDLAFSLLDEMVNVLKIRPNGMTYCALIDVCSRCRRSDLALKGLRMMLREKAKRKRNFDRSNQNDEYSKSKNRSFTLANEVGAWTAAIDACAKAGRLDTAIRLFQNMPKFDVKPNIYTCGALTDGLLKSNEENYLDETLNVLRYMKEEGIEPSEVMYTSLITSASKISKRENEKRGEIVLRSFGDDRLRVPDSKDTDESGDRMKALCVYTELILSLTSHDASAKTPQQKQISQRSKMGRIDTSDEILVKSFLVLQEMKASGADPDIACYNAILKACAKAGDVAKLRDVLRRIELDGLRPNSTTWKQILRGASIARDSTMVEEMWTMALTHQEDKRDDSFLNAKWVPQADEFDSLISSYIREAAKDSEGKSRLYSKVIDAYTAVANKRDERFGFSHIDVDTIMDKPRVVKMVSQAATFFKNNPDLALEIPSMQDNIRQIEKDLN